MVLVLQLLSADRLTDLIVLDDMKPLPETCSPEVVGTPSAVSGPL